MSKVVKTPNEIAEEIDVLGQENEIKAAKWIIEKGKEDEHQENEAEAEAKWKLHDTKNQYSVYREKIYEEAKRLLQTFDIPVGFQFDVALNEKGLLFCYRDPYGKIHARGMKISTFISEDLQCVTRFIHDALDSMEHMEEEIREGRHKSKGGIYIP